MKQPEETAAVTAETVELWDTEKVLVSDKNTRQPTPKDVAELVDSICNSGQLTPGLARPHPTKKGHLELAAGARRRTACHVLGQKFRVIVRDMSDDELLDAILTENLQREDPDPEAEADLIALRVKEGAKPSEIAARYGKTETWVKRRMKLLDVIEPLRKQFAPGKPLAHFTVEMRERLGALPADLQKDLAKDSWALPRLAGMKSLEETITRQSADLKGCKTWLNDPDTFIPGCGPGCATDSSGDLFSDGKSCGRCQNLGCFKQRLALATDKAITTVLAGRKIADMVLFASKGYGSRIRYQSKDINLLDRWDFERHYTVSKTETEIPALDFAIEGKPKRVFLTRKSAAKGSGGKAPGKAESREDKLTGRRLAVLNTFLKKRVLEAPLPAKPGILTLVAAFGTKSSRGGGQHSNDAPFAWDTVDSGEEGFPLDHHGYDKKPKMPLSELLWESIREVIATRLYFYQTRNLLEKGIRAEMRRIAGLIGVDHDAEFARICTDEVKVPKSWGPGIDPVTLKPVAAASSRQPSAAPAKKAARSAKKAAKKAAKKPATKKAKPADAKARSTAPADT